MNELVRALLDFLRNLRPWAVVVPWEEGVRVRLGRHTRTLSAGMHWKIPWVDKVYILPIRRQFVNLPVVDVIALDGKALTLGLTVGFKIESVEALLNSVSQPEDAIGDLVSSFTARYARRHVDFDPEPFEKAAAENLVNSIAGLGSISVAVTTWSTGRRYRFITDKRWASWAPTMNLGERM